MITTSPITMRLNTKVLNAIKSEAKKVGKGYQTVINERLARAVGLVIIPVLTKPKKSVKAKPLVIKAKKKTKKKKK